MSLYTLYPDFTEYAAMGFDEKQIVSLCGNNIHNRFDFMNIPKSFEGIITETLNINFSDNSDGLTGADIPDIQFFNGKLFLSQKAYKIISELISNDGEFFPVTYENGTGYIFNPLKIAEDVDALDESLSIKNEWDDIENMAFHEDRLGNIAIFKSKFDSYVSLYCNEAVKIAIENTDLKGLTITAELGARFGMAQNQKASPH